MSQDTEKRGSAQSADSSGKSTATFSVPDSDIIVSSVVAPKRTHLTAPEHKQSPATTMQPAAAASVSTGQVVTDRWSDGTFGVHNQAATEQSVSENNDSTSYSGKSAEATTAQAAVPKKVTVERVGKRDDTQQSQAGAEATSGDMVGMFAGVDSATLQVITSSAHQALENRGRGGEA
ncbi:hypothetical protein SPI_03501 [Niveomyces insectorum RCEF 264]|uniref:Uncharacterized protein n=1 Tax=Niveomyces insectorum RCEF 264 TaxID=1081102 RepID=A0A167W4U4_9HYPO|nr:hypothetical protein SPI_03501 [Niveomyces insectorum RCEF 264]